MHASQDTKTHLTLGQITTLHRTSACTSTACSPATHVHYVGFSVLVYAEGKPVRSRGPTSPPPRATATSHTCRAIHGQSCSRAHTATPPGARLEQPCNKSSQNVRTQLRLHNPRCPHPWAVVRPSPLPHRQMPTQSGTPRVCSCAHVPLVPRAVVSTGFTGNQPRFG
jgi:hypothetical protein